MDTAQRTDQILLRVCWLLVLGGVIFGGVLFKMYW